MLKKIKILFFLLFFISAFSFAQTITVTNPHGGENWVIGNTYTITWNSSGISGTVGIKLFKDGASLGYIAMDVPNTGSYSWTINNIIGVGAISAGSHYQIQVKKSGVAAGLSREFTISNSSSAASITVTNPHGGENWKIGSTHTITWTSSGISGTVGIKLFKDGASLGYIAQDVPNTGSYTWTINNIIGVGAISTGSGYQIQVKKSGVAADLSDGTFTISKSNININTNINKKFTLVGFPELEVYGTSLHFTGNKSGEVKFHVAVRNIGKVDVSNVPYTFIIDGPPGKYDYYSLQGHFASIPKRMTVVFDKTYVLENEGKYKFSFEVNPNHRAFVEYKYDNNKFEKEIKYIGAPDLVVRVIVGMHSRVAFSHKVWFEVKNIGTRASSECKLRTYIEGKGVKFFDVPHLYPGEKATFTRTVKWLTLGYKKIEAKVDYYNIIREKNENNNKTEVKTKVITGTIFD